MAKIPDLPPSEKIRDLRGTLDFAVWKGQPYVRRWPNKSQLPWSTRSIASSRCFGTFSRAFADNSVWLHHALNAAASHQETWTARDLWTQAIYGNVPYREYFYNQALDANPLPIQCPDPYARLWALHGVSAEHSGLWIKLRFEVFPRPADVLLSIGSKPPGVYSRYRIVRGEPCFLGFLAGGFVRDYLVGGAYQPAEGTWWFYLGHDFYPAGTPAFMYLRAVSTGAPIHTISVSPMMVWTWPEHPGPVIPYFIFPPWLWPGEGPDTTHLAPPQQP